MTFLASGKRTTEPKWEGIAWGSAKNGIERVVLLGTTVESSTSSRFSYSARGEKLDTNLGNSPRVRASKSSSMLRAWSKTTTPNSTCGSTSAEGKEQGSREPPRESSRTAMEDGRQWNFCENRVDLLQCRPRRARRRRAEVGIIARSTKDRRTGHVHGSVRQPGLRSMQLSPAEAAIKTVAWVIKSHSNV